MVKLFHSMWVVNFRPCLVFGKFKSKKIERKNRMKGK